MAMIAHHNQKQENFRKVMEVVRVLSVTDCLELQRCNAISISKCVSYRTNKCQSGCMDIIEHRQLYLVQNYINGKKM
jgi:hypothetical protein